MEWKVPTSYCVHCGDLKRLCHCSKKLTTVKRLESDKVELSEEENRREINGVDASTLVSDKSEITKDEANEKKKSEASQLSVSKTREVFKQLENSNFVQSSSKPGSITSQLVSEDSKISEDISHSVYETFGVRLRPKAKDSTVENKSQTPEKEISSKDGNSTQEAEQDSASKLEEQESSEQQTRRVSEAIASKLALFDSPEQPQTIIPPKISSQSRKGMVCVVCRRVVHPVERFLSPKGELYHTNCLRCAVCHCLLDSTCLNCVDNSFLCNKCFVKKPSST